MSELLIPVNRKLKIWIWFIVNVFFPLLPFFIGGIIRLLTIQQFMLSNFSASQLAMGLAFQSLLISQSLIQNERLLDNEDKQNEAKGMSIVYLIFVCLYIVFFSIIEYTKCLITFLQQNLSTQLFTFECMVFFISPISIIQSYRTQKSYRLKAG